jgi:hypothetical protein
MVTKNNVEQLYHELKTALETLGAKYSVEFDVKNVSYAEFGGNIKLVFSTKDGSGRRVEDPREEIAAKYWFLRNSRPAPEKIIGSEVITNGGKRGKLVGWNKKKRTYPAVLEIGGKSYTASPELFYFADI